MAEEPAARQATREQEAAENYAAQTDDETPLVEDVDVSGKPFRFNPSLHNTLLHQRVDFGSLAPNRARVYDEDGLGRNVTSEEMGDFGKQFHQYRLGRIIQDNTAVAFAATGEYRWGFRFLYNPTAITIASSRNDSLILDGRSQFNIALSGINQNYQSFGIELLLNRMPDVLMPDNRISKNDYSPALYPGDKAQLRRRGTHYDLEFLYRICNGIVPLKDRGKTADIGVIIPVNARLILGKGMNHLGFIESVSYTDEAFSADMVPIRTKVAIQFRRNVDIAASDSDTWATRFQALPGYQLSASSSGGEGTSGGGSASAPGGSAGGNGLVPDPSGTQGRVTQATDNMYDRFMAAYGDIVVSVHCWRSNGLGYIDHPAGHACDFMVTSGGHPSESVRQKGWDAARWLVTHHETLGVGYVIWDRRIWNRSRKAEGWRVYSAGATTSDASTAHTNHLHVTSVSHPEYR